MEWKEVAVAPKYEVSESGKIRAKRSGRILRPFVDRLQEYDRVDLFLGDGSRRRMMVHVLVAEAFLGKKPEGMETIISTATVGTTGWTISAMSPLRRTAPTLERGLT